LLRTARTFPPPTIRHDPPAERSTVTITRAALADAVPRTRRNDNAPSGSANGLIVTRAAGCARVVEVFFALTVGFFNGETTPTVS
jgi:hypothetical protein